MEQLHDSWEYSSPLSPPPPSPLLLPPSPPYLPSSLPSMTHVRTAMTNVLLQHSGVHQIPTHQPRVHAGDPDRALHNAEVGLGGAPRRGGIPQTPMRSGIINMLSTGGRGLVWSWYGGDKNSLTGRCNENCYEELGGGSQRVGAA